MIYVPSGTFTMWEIVKEKENVRTGTKNISVASFYMFPFEVSNHFYQVYLWELKKTDSLAHLAALPDTTVWRDKLAYNEPYVDYYFCHPAYREYPLVGVTHLQCEKFCEWLMEKYNSDPKRKHKKVKFRLPSKVEWMHVAANLTDEEIKRKMTHDKSIAEIKRFPWKGQYMTNEKGQPLANFRMIDQGSVLQVSGKYVTADSLYSENGNFLVAESNFNPCSYNGYIMDCADVTAPVTAYQPNVLGLYNLAGNVEEFVLEYGITKGGSWCDTGYYLQNFVEEYYTKANEATSSRGFRFVMEVVE